MVSQSHLIQQSTDRFLDMLSLPYVGLSQPPWIEYKRDNISTIRVSQALMGNPSDLLYLGAGLVVAWMGVGRAKFYTFHYSGLD